MSRDIHVFFHGTGVDAKLDQVLNLLNKIFQGVQTMSAELDALEAQVTANTSTEASAIQLLNGLHAMLVAAGTDPTKLNALKASLSTSATDLAAAIVANTPAATP